MRAVPLDPFDRDDRWPVAIIAAIPLLTALPAILGWIAADPLLYTGQLAQHRGPGILPGVAAIDPNNGYTTQALGVRSALEWLGGNVPWWNAYSGVGLPLAAEYQPGSFSPLTFLLLLPNGMAWMHAALQVVAGLGAYGLSRQLGTGRPAALAGGLLFAFNGTLAWFAHGPATAAAWIPWMAWGVERAYVHAREASAGGWRLFAVALAMSLVAAFPETAYIGGLLALAWALVRASELPRSARLSMAMRIVPAGLVGLAITAPQTASFFHYLAHAEIGGHADFSRAGFPWFASIPVLLAPYFYGPLFGLGVEWKTLWDMWGGLGGYSTASLLVVAAYGLAARPTRLNWMLAAWIVMAIGKSFVMQPAVFLWNLVPGVTIAAFARYVPPTWELALIVLSVAGIDALLRGEVPSRRPLLAAAAATAALLAVGLFVALKIWPVFPPGSFLRLWSVASGTAAAGVALLCLAILWRSSAGAARCLAALLVVEAILLFKLPLLSTPRGSRADGAAIAFLKEHLGFSRFYTLGPIQPNYGAYFGIASINHNYLPVAKRWAEFVTTRLDSAADPVIFNGNYARPPGAPGQAQELRRNLSSYEWVGVKYVVASTANPPFPPGDSSAKRVHSDPSMTIYELPAPKPYFEVVQGRCEIDARERTRARATCAGPSRLVRRELFFPGWRATVNGTDASIAEHGDLFQEIALPAGASEVRFDYAPPYIGWAWLAAGLGFLTLIVGFARKGGSTTRS